MKDCRGIAADCVGRKRDWGLWRKWGSFLYPFIFLSPRAPFAVLLPLTSDNIYLTPSNDNTRNNKCVNALSWKLYLKLSSLAYRWKQLGNGNGGIPVKYQRMRQYFGHSAQGSPQNGSLQATLVIKQKEWGDCMFRFLACIPLWTLCKCTVDTPTRTEELVWLNIFW